MIRSPVPIIPSVPSGSRLIFASGYATLGQVGFEHRCQYTANGSVINLASRLCDEAKSGQILISQRAFGAIERWVKASHIGQLRLKGFNRPIDAYEVVRRAGDLC